jgi:hypothetical protein
MRRPYLIKRAAVCLALVLSTTIVLSGLCNATAFCAWLTAHPHYDNHLWGNRCWMCVGSIALLVVAAILSVGIVLLKGRTSGAYISLLVWLASLVLGQLMTCQVGLWGRSP